MSTISDSIAAHNEQWWKDNPYSALGPFTDLMPRLEEWVAAEREREGREVGELFRGLNCGDCERPGPREAGETGFVCPGLQKEVDAILAERYGQGIDQIAHRPHNRAIMENPKTSNGDWTDYAPVTTGALLTEPGPLERFRVAAGDGPAEIRRKNRAAMEAMVTEVG